MFVIHEDCDNHEFDLNGCLFLGIFLVLVSLQLIKNTNEGTRYHQNIVKKVTVKWCFVF
jgi:hypothetical protein